MGKIGNGIVILVALLHVWFMVLEMFFWTKPLGLKTFGRTLEDARSSKVLAANQGFYNGILAAGLFLSFFLSNPETASTFQQFFLWAVLAAGIMGGVTASRKILWVQALPAAIALVLIYASR